MNAPSVRATIESRLRERFAPVRLEVIDESAAHAGHAGAAGGGGHYRVTVVSAAFERLGRLERHRLIYEQFRDLMPGTIHALAIRARAPSEDGR